MQSEVAYEAWPRLVECYTGYGGRLVRQQDLNGRPGCEAQPCSRYQRAPSDANEQLGSMSETANLQLPSRTPRKGSKNQQFSVHILGPSENG